MTPQELVEKTKKTLQEKGMIDRAQKYIEKTLNNTTVPEVKQTTKEEQNRTKKN